MIISDLPILKEMTFPIGIKITILKHLLIKSGSSHENIIKLLFDILIHIYFTKSIIYAFWSQMHKRQKRNDMLFL